MIQTIVFSKNRPAQLDLLLRSTARAKNVFGHTTVVYKATTEDYAAGYQQCKTQNPDVLFQKEVKFEQEIFDLLTYGTEPYVTFLCDDDIVVRPFTDQPTPDRLLAINNKLLCVSLRLGSNTTNCYPLKRVQATPTWNMAVEDSRMWYWADADGDWGYPGSLDGHVFRRELLRIVLADAIFAGPNELEDRLSVRCAMLYRAFPLMACYSQSVLTGVPVNAVNTTHTTNRHGDLYPREVEELNDMYLKGKRLNLGEFSRKQVTGAHTELELSFT